MMELFSVFLIAGIVILYVWGIKPLLKNMNNEKTIKDHYNDRRKNIL